MAPKRVLCGYGVDVDAVANWVSRTSWEEKRQPR